MGDAYNPAVAMEADKLYAMHKLTEAHRCDNWQAHNWAHKSSAWAKVCAVCWLRKQRGFIPSDELTHGLRVLSYRLAARFDTQPSLQLARDQELDRAQRWQKLDSSPAAEAYAASRV